MALNVYLVPTLIYGWFIWGKDENTKPVEFVSWKMWPVYLGVTALTYLILYAITTKMNATLAYMDSFLLVGSILAQWLMDRKKIENWLIWTIVNVVSIYTYWEAGLVVLAIQFIFFLLNAFWGLYEWRRSMKQNA
jgi:nicotinamide mononucleotide transporter